MLPLVYENSCALLDLVVELREKLHLPTKISNISTEETLNTRCVHFGLGFNWDLAIHFHRMLVFLQNQGKEIPYKLFSLSRDQSASASLVFSSMFNTFNKDYIRFYEEVYYPRSSVSSKIREFIKSYYDENGNCCEGVTNALTCSDFRNDLWKLVEFVFNKHEMEMISEINGQIVDQTGELFFSNVTCTMYSNKFNIFCFEFQDDFVDINQWNDTIFIPMALLYFHGLKNKFHNAFLSIIKHSNNNQQVTIFTGQATDLGIVFGPNYVLDLKKSKHLGVLFGTIIQYSDSVNAWKHMDYFNNSPSPVNTQNPWGDKSEQFAKLRRKIFNQQQKREENQFRTLFSKMKVK